MLGAGLAELFLLVAGDDIVVLDRDTAGLHRHGRGQPRPDPPGRHESWPAASTVPADRVLPGRRRARARCSPRARVRRSRGRCAGVRRARDRVRQGAPAVRSPDRDVPGGQAPLRQHARGIGARHRRGVGRGARGRGRRRPVRARGGSRGGAVGARVPPQRAAQHPGARRHRLHVGARRPHAAAPRGHVGRAVRRRGRGPGRHRLRPRGHDPRARARPPAGSRSSCASRRVRSPRSSPRSPRPSSARS